MTRNGVRGVKVMITSRHRVTSPFFVLRDQLHLSHGSANRIASKPDHRASLDLESDRAEQR